MKTAISIPDDVFKRAEYLAKKRGVSRSEFYVAAIKAFIEPPPTEITGLLDAVYGKDDSFDDRVESGALRDLPREDW